MKQRILIAIVCLIVSCGTAQKNKERKWIYLNIDVFKAQFNDVQSLVDTSKKAGANGIVLVEVKTNYWWTKNYATQFRNAVTRIRDEVKRQSMDFIILGDSVTWCFGPLSADKNFAAGYPMKDVPMKVGCGGSCLEAEETAEIPNGSFETSNGNSANGWFQEAPGTTTFIDTQVKKSGSQSMRTKADIERYSLFLTSVKVRQFQQYTLSFWTRAAALSTQYIAVEIRDAGTDILLTQQQISLPDDDGSRIYFHGTKEQTFDWTQMRIAFNSLMATSVEFTFGVWAGSSGSAWWDDIKLSSTPTLNLLRRASLPLSLTTSGNGGAKKLVEGKDFKRVVDPGLGIGTAPFDGSYDTYHDAPRISVLAAAALSVGDSVMLSGYHAVPSLVGRVGCSWSDQQQLARVVMSYSRNMDAFKPDGFVLDHVDVLHGGWEPAERKKKSSGRAFAAYLKQETAAISRVLPASVSLFIWSQLLDPNSVASNKCKCIPFNKSLKDAYKGADPSKLTILTSDEFIDFELAQKSYAFFDEKKFRQIAVGFRDDDVVVNHRNWQDIIGKRPSAGSMYFTRWPGDYLKITEFGQLWWS